MNKIISVNILSCVFMFNLCAQELIEFSMGPGYQYDIYYSLSDGLVAYPERDNWELAFSTNPDDKNIRINSGNSVTLFQVSDNIDDWDQISLNSSNDIQLRNSNISWDIGAFTSNVTGELNYGWGDYNVKDQIIEGTCIYIINYGNSIKKIKINSLSDGVFNFTVANLDGSDEETQNINTGLYDDKKFIYYSLENMEIIDREPASENWDIVFTKYEVDLNKELGGGEMFYNVTGALTNNNFVYQNDEFLDVNPVFELSDMSNSIGVIGWDWKEYGGGGYSIIPNRSYFILNQNKTVLYKIVFQTFSGGSSGNCSFLVEQVDYNPSSLDANSVSDVNLYPNPNNGNFYITTTCQNNMTLKLRDYNGQILLIQNITSAKNVHITDLKKGLYFINLESDQLNINKKVIVK